MVNNNPQLIWKSKAKGFHGWASAMEQVYGKDITLEDFVIKLKKEKFKNQINFINKRFDYK